MMDWLNGTFFIGIAIGAFAGVPFGALIMGTLSARAYEKGRSDGRAERGQGGRQSDHEAKWILGGKL